MATVDAIKTFQTTLRTKRDNQQRLQGKLEQIQVGLKKEYEIATLDEAKKLLREKKEYREEQQERYDRIMKEIGALHDEITG
jgi:hypothetical protein